MKDGKMGLTTGNVDVVVPAEMDEVYTPVNELVVFKKDGKYGFAMLGTDLVTSPDYDEYDFTDSEYLIVYKDGVKGFIDDEAAFTTDEDEKFFNSLF